MCISLIYITGSNYCIVLCIKCWCSGLTLEFRPYMRYFMKYSLWPCLSDHENYRLPKTLAVTNIQQWRYWTADSIATVCVHRCFFAPFRHSWDTPIQNKESKTPCFKPFNLQNSCFKFTRFAFQKFQGMLWKTVLQGPTKLILIVTRHSLNLTSWYKFTPFYRICCNIGATKI